MSLRPMARLDPSFHRPDPLVPCDLNRDLEQHVAAGFPADLALDLVLNELVVRAASVAGASGAAAALLRAGEMVIRAATGRLAPDLGVPLSTGDGLAGACVRTLSPQLSNDIESDPRVDRAALRGLGIRSILIVPVLDDIRAPEGKSQLIGILEVLSPVPNAFSDSSQVMLAEFARECASLHRRTIELQDHSSEAELVRAQAIDAESTEGAPIIPDTELFRSFELAESDFPDPVAPTRQPYQVWTLVLASLVIVAAVALSFLVGRRVGWLRALATSPPIPVSTVSAPVADTVNPPVPAMEEPAPLPRKKKVAPPPQADASNAPMSPSDQLVVYEKGKVVYRMKAQPLKAGGDAAQVTAATQPALNASPQPAPSEHAPNQMASSVIPASSKQRLSDRVWLAPDQAATLLLNRVEPQYPQAAMDARHSGSVVLEVNVAEDGSVSSVRPLIGDPTLAAAAAQAVRSWRYQPLRSHEQPSPFQTDVTLTFTLPN